MKIEFKKGNKIFSEILKQKIEEKLCNNEQVILLLNRRGYSTIINCKCGYTEKCPNCDIPLVYHKTSNNLRCHYCGYSKNTIHKCPECGSEEIMDFGLGTQKLEELVNVTFKDAKVVRMDIDSTTKKDAHYDIIKDFKNKKYNILIGTQMVAKGLDFEDVTLVGVINGDASLNMPDFRSSERTFSLLNQVVGRAGRSVKKGDAIIQTFNTDHYSILNASKNDYLGFYNEEMKVRKTLNYPPFYSLALIKIKGTDYNMVYQEANKIKKYLMDNIKNQILGPTPASVLKINNIYYLQIIIKYKKVVEIYDKLDYIYNRYKVNKVRVDIDLNPVKI
jgi:primosomal protein N' (replication factor Y) (superfamily II helicase)